MSKIRQFQTNGTTTSGWAADTQTNLTFYRSPRAFILIDLKQVSCGVVANDADWELWVDYKTTGIVFQAELLNPVTVGQRRLLATPIVIHPGAIIQFRWSGQVAAASNILNVEYEEQ